MVVQHNMQAMNANRMLGITTGQQSKSTEKLSSGYRINRAADDAAGLTISEKMRKQIRGLDRASTNAQDGISCVQTAEGALTEVHSMLQRMNELAVQAANGTMSENDRKATQAEIDQLITEIDRVSETTKFNEIYLLKGDGQEDKTREVAAKPMTAAYKTAPTEEVVLKTGQTLPTWYAKGETTALSQADLLKNLEIKDDGSIGLKSGAEMYKVAAQVGNEYGAQLPAQLVKAADITTTLFGKQSTALYKEAAGTTKVTDEELKDYFNTDGSYKGGLYRYKSDGTVAEVGAERIEEFVKVTKGVDATTETYQVGKALEFKLHVGSESPDANKIAVEIKAMSATGIGVDVLKEDGLMSQDDATAAIDIISKAIETVSEQRSDLGAIQNRLEHTITNLDNIVENTTAAESRIRDLDMAEEMVEYSKNNILAQAGQSMLAQANQSTQGVLSLLG